MAEIAVEILAANLRQLKMSENARLVRDVRHEIEMIESTLRVFKDFLRDSSKMQRKDQIHQELIRQITDAVYGAEDIIDAYVSHASEMKSKNYFMKSFANITTTISVHDVARKLQSVSEQIQGNPINAVDSSSFDDEDRELLHKITEPLRIRESNVVGLEEEIEKVTGYLNEETEGLDVITIVGMPGTGKTTLAWITFHRQEVVDKFPTRIWIHVSNNFSERGVFLEILKNNTQITDDISDKGDEELAKLAAAYLEREKFLIVMDDVWSPHDWDRLRIALPKLNEKGRVLITSCNEIVGLHTNRFRVPHKVRLLTQAESWSLLKSEVFGEQECPPELEKLGRIIAEECEGLPLAILALARTLVEEELSAKDMTERRVAWTKVGFRVPQYRNNIFYLSLPFHLRYCFLYFGMFPYDFEIPVWKLIRMWIAEGFIQPCEGLSVEETAETYLKELISRNLVTVGRTKSDGNIKTCRVHRMMHEFCKIEDGKERENFLQEIMLSDGDSDTEVSELPNCRRLCIHSNVLGFLSSKPFGPHVRSFVSFSNEDIILPVENNSIIPLAFKLLRVLDANPIRFTKVPIDMYQLLHLRYLVISTDLSILPKVFSRLSKIQTLVVDTKSRILEFRGDILGFTELRHFKTNASTILGRHGTSNHGQQLQTLGTISSESCTKELLERASNLKKLGIRGRLYAFFKGTTGSFDSLGKLNNLENLKLLNDVFPKSPSLDPLHKFPPASKFPATLRSLTLVSTFLPWNEMQILGSLEMLKVLKLKDNAFVGRIWDTHDVGFHSLEALHIERTDLAIWVASAHHFPQLKRLQLYYCEQLREVPFQLANIPTLQHLELLNSKHAAASARKIEYEIKERQHEEGPRKNAKEFKLSVFPNE